MPKTHNNLFEQICDFDNLYKAYLKARKCKRYRPEDHERLRDMIKNITGKVIISYDDHPVIRKLYKKFHIHGTGPVLYTMNNRRNTPERRISELIITNF